MEMSTATKIADLVDKSRKTHNFAKCIEDANIFGITITITSEHYDTHEPISCTINTNDLFNDKYSNVEDIESVLRHIKTLCEKRSTEIGKEINEI